jgi:retinol dehydrogenase-14
LARLVSVREFAAGFNGPREAVHVLVNNAGALFAARHLTEDGCVWLCV